MNNGDNDEGGSGLSIGAIIIYSGIVLGNLEWLLDMVFAFTITFESPALSQAALVFVIVQPVWFWFMYTVYVASHQEIDSGKDRCKKILLAPLYAIMQQTKILGGIEKLHDKFANCFGMKEQFHLITLENCFKVQILTELVGQTIPQMIIQAQQGNRAEWTGLGRFCCAVHIIMFVKNLALVTIYALRRFIDTKDDPPMRPRTSGISMTKVEKEAFAHIQSYLIDPHDDGLDADGNTTVHQEILKAETQWNVLIKEITENPHHLFMVNKFGQTPLDIAIQETTSTVSLAKSHMVAKAEDVVKIDNRRVDRADYASVGDINLEGELTLAPEKARFLIDKMGNFGPECSLKYVKKPQRLALKFEKSFTMAVKKNKTEIFELFPKYSVKTVYVSTHQLHDYAQYKQDKDSLAEILTTPLHLACQKSNMDAVRILVEHHGYDVNVLLNEKNFLYELLQNSNYDDYSIMNMIFKKRKPQINSGSKLALNQAILRGNPFMIKTLLQYGDPNPFVIDYVGNAPIHIAAQKLDQETFEELVRLGADAMMPDAKGDTFLHLMAKGTIKDSEYDFIKQAVMKYGLRLTRNNEGRTALNIIRAYSAQAPSMRGQPNFKKKIWEFFDLQIVENPNFIDGLEDTELMTYVQEGNLQAIKNSFTTAENKSVYEKDEALRLLETRNKEGKTAFYLAAELDKADIISWLVQEYPTVNMFARDTTNGDTALHLACRNRSVEIVKSILANSDASKCLKQNFSGQTSILLATISEDKRILDLFEEHKYAALMIRDRLGENPLFTCARNGNEAIFNWYSGDNEFFKARGHQNYLGQTIEHIVCLNRKHAIVDEIRPRPDTPDYFGNLPLYYTLRQDDVPMVEKQWTATSKYFSLRNYKMETIFHVAAKNNAIQSLEKMIGKCVFLPHMLKKDYEGNTAIHIAAKVGSLEMLEFLLSSVTPGFLEMQNDFGFTPLEAAQNKAHLMDQALVNKEGAEKLKYAEKVDRVRKAIAMITNYSTFVNEARWDARFDMQMEMFLDQVADSNMRIFMGMPKAQDLQVQSMRMPAKAAVEPQEPIVKATRKVAQAPDTGANEAPAELIKQVDDEERGD